MRPAVVDPRLARGEAPWERMDTHFAWRNAVTGEVVGERERRWPLLRLLGGLSRLLGPVLALLWLLAMPLFAQDPDEPWETGPVGIQTFAIGDSVYARLRWTVVRTDSGSVAWYYVNSRAASSRNCVEPPYPSCQGRVALLVDSVSFVGEPLDSIEYLSVDVPLGAASEGWWIGASVLPVPVASNQQRWIFYEGWATPVQLLEDLNVPPPTVFWDYPPPPPDSVPPDSVVGEVRLQRDVRRPDRTLVGRLFVDLDPPADYVAEARLLQTSGWLQGGDAELSEVGHVFEACLQPGRCECLNDGNAVCGCTIDPYLAGGAGLVGWSVTGALELVYPVDYLAPLVPREECFDVDGVRIPCDSGWDYEPLTPGSNQTTCRQRQGNPHRCDPPAPKQPWELYGPCVEVRRTG